MRNAFVHLSALLSLHCKGKDQQQVFSYMGAHVAYKTLVFQDPTQMSRASQHCTALSFNLSVAHRSSPSTIVLRLESGTSKGMSWRGSLL